MANKELIFDISTLDMDHVIADIEVIRKYNPQRYEMEQLTGILYEDNEAHICVGYKDVLDSEFWVRGHMPNMPLMPGVVMLEAMAQLCSYYTQKNDLLKSKIVGFGGVENVHFRGPVRPGDRLILMGQLIKVRPRRMIVSRFQGVVNQRLILDGVLKGIALPVDELTSTSN